MRTDIEGDPTAFRAPGCRKRGLTRAAGHLHSMLISTSIVLYPGHLLRVAFFAWLADACKWVGQACMKQKSRAPAIETHPPPRGLAVSLI